MPSHSFSHDGRQGIARVLVVGIMAGVAIGLFAAVFTWIATSKSFTDTDKLDVAMRQAVQGNYTLAAAIAESIDDSELSDEDRAKKLLAEGLLLWERSQEYLEHKKSLETADQALEKLQAAEELGFPLGYEGLGQFALGMVQSQLRQGDDALPALRKGALRWPNGRSDAIAAAIQILLDRRPIPFDEVANELEHWRSLPGLSPSDHDLANLIESRLLDLQGYTERALAKLDSIRPDSSHHFQSELEKVLLLRELAKGESKPELRRDFLEKALDIARAVNEAPLANSAIRRSSMFHTASLLRALERNDEALSIFSRIRLGHPETPEALASGMEEIEILLEEQRTQEALTILSYLRTHIADLRWFDAGGDSLDAIRKRMLTAGHGLIKEQLFDEAIEYAKQLPILCNASDRYRLMAEANRAHGEKIASDAGYAVDRFGAAPLRLSGEVLTQAKDHFRRAGLYFDKLSTQELRAPEYSELLWQAIECYRTSHDLEACNELLDRYMLYENRGKRPRALLVKSENLITSRDLPKAIQTLQQLMEFYSDSPLIYPARMLAAQAFGEEQRFDEASDMLLKNLYDGALSPESTLWRDSLIELGDLLLKRGELLNLEAGKIRENKLGVELEIERLTESQAHLRSSIDRFKDALMRFGDDPRSLRLQYNIAQAYRLASALPKRLLDEELVEVETKRKRNVQQRRELLTSAMQNFVSLRNKIQQQMDPLSVDPSKQNMLRNCFFGEADILFELGDYPAALNAYNAAATQYMNEPEVMEALIQKSRCHDLMGNKKESRQVLLQAQQILKRIPAEKDAKFTQVTRYDREQWSKHLDWMASIPTSTK